jgi:glyoxylase I family protein
LVATLAHHGQMAGSPLPTLGFSHVAFRVRDVEKTIAFYRDLLGWEQLFDICLGGEEVEHASGVDGAVGRMAGGRLGGVRVEFAQLPGVVPVTSPEVAPLGFLSLSLQVSDTDDLYRTVVELGVPHDGPPHEVGGHRMLVLRDPDDNAVQLIQYPDGEHA